MRTLLLLLSILLLPMASARAEVHFSLGVAIPGVSIGIHIPAYPRLVRVPGHPVYYDPYLDFNLFFYDGLYWVFAEDDWYVSDWYDGPWRLVTRMNVPIYLLRIPVHYYRRPPHYFRDWRPDRPPRWDDHWGGEWHEHRGDWDRKDHHAPPRAPLPYYQQHYSGKSYPQQPDVRETIRREHYHYQPRDPVSKQHYPSPRHDDRRDDRRGR